MAVKKFSMLTREDNTNEHEIQTKDGALGAIVGISVAVSLSVKNGRGKQGVNVSDGEDEVNVLDWAGKSSLPMTLALTYFGYDTDRISYHTRMDTSTSSYLSAARDSLLCTCPFHDLPRAGSAENVASCFALSLSQTILKPETPQ